MNANKRNKPEEIKAGSVKVKIYRRVKAGYEVFEIADYSHGSRRLRSFSNYDEARTEAKRIANLMASGETTAAQIRNPQAASYGRAVELLRPTGVSLELAAAHFAEAFRILNGDLIVAAAQYYAARNQVNRQKRHIADVAAEMISIKTARGISEQTLNDMRWRLARLAGAFGADPTIITGPHPADSGQEDKRNRGLDIDSITTGDVQKWLDGMKGSPRSVMNFRRMAGTLFSFAAARGYIPKGENPVTSTEKIKARNNVAVEIYTPAELEKIFAAAHESFRLVIALGAFAGLRSAEIERLDWSEIDLKGGMIEVKAEKTKTASRRLVPIVPTLKAWLKPQAKTSGAIWSHSHPFFHERQREAATGAGLDAWKPNGLRHSFISYRLAQVKSAPQVALEAGNSPTMIFQHYRELVKPDAAKKWFSITPESVKTAKQ